MTHRDKIDLEIRNLAIRNIGKCRALLELPMLIYSQIMIDNDLRIRPYRVSCERIRKIIHSMPELRRM